MIRNVSSRLKVGVALVATLSQLAAGPAAAFCGFYVAKADAKLFNRSSKVVLTRDGNQTAITMASDYEGDPKEFAVVSSTPRPSIISMLIRRHGWSNIATPIPAVRLRNIACRPGPAQCRRRRRRSPRAARA
jgi:hypothetical protein